MTPLLTPLNGCGRGAPTGISQAFALDGVLEPVDPETPLPVEALSTEWTDFQNYVGVESDPEALAIIDEYVSRGWLKEFDSHQSLSDYLGDEPVFSKFACICKSRADGTVKRRIIMDSKRSMVTEASRKQYKSVLPCVTDLLTDVLALQAGARDAETVRLLVLDAEDAFWQIPLHRSEQRFYCAQLRRKDGSSRFLTFVRTAQGARGSPLSWAIIFGLICRLVLGFFALSSSAPCAAHGNLCGRPNSCLKRHML